VSHGSLEAEFAAAVTDPALPVPGWALSPRGDVDAKRFAVYRNNVHVGLVGALRSKFPVVSRLVGDEFFTAMARVYVGMRKPASPILAVYGADFPDFVASFEPAGTLPYLADVARLEATWLSAYHAADAKPLYVAALAAVDEDRLLSMRLVPHPAARLLASTYPVGSIWAANQAEIVAPVSVSGAEAVLIARPGADVTLRIIAAGDHAFCESLFAGEPIGVAAGRGSDAAPDFNASAALVGLLASGAFMEIDRGGDAQ
jgi:hypothetical protein